MSFFFGDILANLAKKYNKPYESYKLLVILYTKLSCSGFSTQLGFMPKQFWKAKQFSPWRYQSLRFSTPYHFSEAPTHNQINILPIRGITNKYKSKFLRWPLYSLLIKLELFSDQYYQRDYHQGPHAYFRPSPRIIWLMAEMSQGMNTFLERYPSSLFILGQSHKIWGLRCQPLYGLLHPPQLVSFHQLGYYRNISMNDFKIMPHGIRNGGRHLSNLS